MKRFGFTTALVVLLALAFSVPATALEFRFPHFGGHEFRAPEMPQREVRSSSFTSPFRSLIQHCVQERSFDDGGSCRALTHGFRHFTRPPVHHPTPPPPNQPPASTTPLRSLTVSPLQLKPAFSPSTFDYVVPCATGTNTLTLTIGAITGGTVALVDPATTPSRQQTDTVNLVENQAVTIHAADGRGHSADYWIRCLPHDFPPLNITRHPENGAPTPGWYLTSNVFAPPGGSFAMILDSNGTPVWYKRAVGAATNITPLGKNTVAYLDSAAGATFNADLNRVYDVHDLATNQTSHIGAVGTPVDFHELQTLPNGNHLLLAYRIKTGVNLTGLPAENGNPAPGANSTMADCEVQEVDPQGQLVWQWDASDHIDPLTETTFPDSHIVNGQLVYDVYHCNSIDANATTGDLLVSARHTDAVFDIRRSDGKVVWKLGGTPTNKDGAQLIPITGYAQSTIRRQHDARFLPNGDISLFDNQFPLAGPAQAVEFSLAGGVATPVFQFGAPSGVPSVATGSFRHEPDGHTVICWGISTNDNGSFLSELDGQGRDVLDMSFAPGSAAYRTLKVAPDGFDVNVLRATAGT